MLTIFRMVAIALCVSCCIIYFASRFFNISKIASMFCRALASLSVLSIVLMASFICKNDYTEACFGIISMAVAFAAFSDIFSEMRNYEKSENLCYVNSISNTLRFIAALFCAYAFILICIDIGHTLEYVLIALGVAVLAFNVHIIVSKKCKKFEKFTYDVISNSLVFAAVMFGCLLLLLYSLSNILCLLVFFAYLLFMISSIIKNVGFKKNWHLDSLLYYLGLILVVLYFVI